MSDEKSPPGSPTTTPEYPRGSRSSSGFTDDPEAIKQLRKLHDAAVLASQSKFRCEVCSRVHHLKNGVVVVARKNILMGLCLECAHHTRVVIRPMADGSGVHIGVEPDMSQSIVIPAASLSEIREVETSKLSDQRAEKTDLGDNAEDREDS